jgi:putative membrane protein
MDPSYNLLAAVLNFATYFGLSLLLLVAFKFLYTLVTPHDEWQLIKGGKNTAAATGFGGAVLGYAIALGGAASNSVSLVDFATWSAVALVAQLFAFAIVRFVFMPRIVARIEDGEVSAGVMLAATAISVGVLNSACMSY